VARQGGAQHDSDAVSFISVSILNGDLDVQVLCALQESCAVVTADASLAEALAAMDEAGQVCLQQALCLHDPAAGWPVTRRSSLGLATCGQDVVLVAAEAGGITGIVTRDAALRATAAAAAAEAAAGTKPVAEARPSLGSCIERP